MQFETLKQQRVNQALDLNASEQAREYTNGFSYHDFMARNIALYFNAWNTPCKNEAANKMKANLVKAWL
jgi:hypothetical protein